ncbi:MAG TPA: SUF system Fe-S cluster assembly regulator [Alphaproteobacteria bacterium]|jgi:FeS assembly SUF system regulator|nr:SUF system Fe-S cluster assembly regulator [Alphaproteobacteria bacterium]HRK98404.1 SUF system Fe-S cluster assembly regulator [Alphaproteobacteria bacterium]
MIKLSKLSDYAIVVLSQLAADQGRLYTAAVLAQQTGIPEPTVAKVLKLLSRREIVNSMRGVKGGYAMTRIPSQVTVTELIEALEGPISITSCADIEVETSCHIAGLCPMRGSWHKVNVAVKSALNEVFLSDLLIPMHRPEKRGQA